MCLGEARASSFLQIGAAVIVQQHVHPGDRPDYAIEFLAEQIGLAPVLPMLVDVFLGRDQHAARPTARVIELRRFDRALTIPPFSIIRGTADKDIRPSSLGIN